MTLTILVPVLKRPHRVEPLLQAVQRSTPEPYRVLFVADPDDAGEIKALKRAKADYIQPGGSYAHKINAAVRVAAPTPYLFLAADDIEPLSGWFQAARDKLKDGIGVVGVNDLIPRKRAHATHFLLTRDYAKLPTIDGAAGPLHEGYGAWFCDDELIATAKHRGTYAYAKQARVRHLHPTVNRAEDDETYRLGRKLARRDRNLYQQRRKLWNVSLSR